MASKPLPPGIRNNNPCNLVHVAANKWQGLADPPSDGRFCVFVDMPSGIRAAALLLQSYQDRHGLNTIRGWISRWAPASENDVEAYIDTVCLVSGFSDDQPLDAHNYAHVQPVMRGMFRHENGRAAAALVTAAQLDEGLRRAGLVPPLKPKVKDPEISLHTVSATVTTISATVASTEPVWNTLARIHPDLPIIVVAGLAAVAVMTAGYFILRRLRDRRQGIA